MNKKMTVIITMAGLGSRFKRVGYQCPKYQIEANGKSLFEWSMDSLIDHNPHVLRYIFIVRKEDHAENFIREKCRPYRILDIHIVEIDSLTDGQATTAMLAMPYCNAENPILIYNIDTYVEPHEMKFEDLKGDGHIPCFHAPGNHWSFVRLDEAGKAVEIREKERISNNCSLGAYYFSSAELYSTLYKEYYQERQDASEKERYIAPLYQYMLQKGLEVTVSIVDKSKVHVLGTPEELENFIKVGVK